MSAHQTFINCLHCLKSRATIVTASALTAAAAAIVTIHAVANQFEEYPYINMDHSTAVSAGVDAAAGVLAATAAAGLSLLFCGRSSASTTANRNTAATGAGAAIANPLTASLVANPVP